MRHCRTAGWFFCCSLLTMAAGSLAADSGVSPDCTWHGKKLYGKIQAVENFPDVKVKIVTAFPDLKVQVVSAFPNKCGKWQMVENFPDLRVKFVEEFPDVKIQYVDAFPGLP